MRTRKRKPTIPTTKVVRTLILFFPLGLCYVWKRQCRWTLGVKALVSAVTVLCVIGLFMGTLSFFPTQDALRVQASVVQKRWQEDYPLFADPDGVCYHVEGCVHLKEGANPIVLQKAYEMGVMPDVSCNPPTYDARN